MKSKKSFYSIKPNYNLTAEIKDVDSKSRTVSGVFNTFNYLDSANDVLLPGCCNKSITERGPMSAAIAKIVQAKNHDLTKIPGKIKVLDEREINYSGRNLKCLYFETVMGTSTLGSDELKDYSEGIIQNHSIGFQYDEGNFLRREAHGNSKEANDWKAMQDSLINPDQLEATDYVFAVSKIKLFEGSSVAIGANTLTPNLGMKSKNGSEAKAAYELMLVNRIDKLQRVLKNGTQSDERMVLFDLELNQLKQIAIDLCSKLSPKKLGVIKNVENFPKKIISLTNISPNFVKEFSIGD